MKNTVKRILSSVLCLVMLITLLPTDAFAADTTHEKLEVDDGYLKITVSEENGGFLIDTVEGNKLDKEDDNKNLLYPAADFDTSYTSFQVTRANPLGGTTTEEYIFGRKYGFLGMDTQDLAVTREGNSIVATWGVKDLTVKQTLTLLDETASLHGMANISYTVSTTGDDIVDVKMRVMYDTALGFQDYATYEVPNRLNEYTHVIKETVIDNSGENEGDNYSGTLFAVDNPYSPRVTAYTVDAVLDGKTVSPYQLAFGHWNNLATSVFDFVPQDVNFTNAYSQEYMTADSAYAMYYDLGAVTAGQDKSFSTYYGIYSNATLSEEETVSINFPVQPTAMELKEDDSNAYVSQVPNGADGDVQLKMMLENISGETYEEVTLVVETMNNIYPYEDYLYFPEQKGEEAEPLKMVYTDFQYGEELIVDTYFNVTPLIVTEYRRFKVLCYNTTNGDELTDARLIGSREFYLFCPGELGETVVFNSISPDLIYYEGTRNIFLSGLNFAMLKDPTAYTAILRPVSGNGEDVVVPATNVVVDSANGTVNLVVDQQMAVGAYQVVFDWIDETKEDSTDEMMRFQVTDDLTKVSPTYGVVTVEKAEDFTEAKPTYKIGLYQTEAIYQKAFTQAERNTNVYLEFRGDFGVRYENGRIAEVRANSLTDVKGNPLSTINISNCLDVECGTVALVVDNPGEDDQVINIDIDGKVYTTNARTSIWDGVCAITSFENGNLNTMLQYDYEGESVGDIENAVANTNAITLLWPSAAGTAQTIAGMFFEFRYCQFGLMALEKGSVTDDMPKMRVISFGAELSPDFLLPSNFNWGEREASSLDVAQLALAKKNYTADQLRDVQDRCAGDFQKMLDAERGSLSLFVTDILFGGGFAGFNTTIEVTLPEYFDTLPSLSGTLNLKVLPANMYRDGRIWEFGIAGSADLIMIEMEASFGMKETPAGFPAIDHFYCYVEGGFPGINIDTVGCFWVIGLGGGMSNIYDTMFVVSELPPMALTLTAAFRIYQVLEAKASMTASLRGFEVSMQDISIARINVMDELGFSAYWYPEFRLRANMYLSILDIINGGGYIVVEENKKNNSYFWEGFASASVQTPDLVIIPSIRLGSVDLGVNASKIWGAMHVLKMDMGLTYFWGGDVDFAFGKYDAPESTYPLSVMAVGQDPDTGKVLYMSLGTNVALVATTDPQLAKTTNSTRRSGGSSIDSTADGMSHVINLGAYDAAKDNMLSISFTAESQEDAEAIAKGSGMVRKGLTLTAEGGSDTYALTWLDTGKPADEQPDANAMLAYNAETKKATVTISFTEQSAYEQPWVLTSDVETTVGLYEIAKLPGLDDVTYSRNGDQLTIDTLTGYELETIGEVSVYAVAADGQMCLLGTVDAADPSAQPIDLPADLPSGEYTLRVVANSEAENICSAVDAAEPFAYVNPLQPEAPSITGVTLGGDYTLDVDVTADSNVDGYRATIYECVDGNWVPVEDFANVFLEDDDGKLTLGGSYTTFSYTDAEGNPVPAAEAVNTQEIVHTLVDGKAYRAGIAAYRNDDRGIPVYSVEVMTNAVTMVAPVKANVTVKAVDARTIDAVMDSNTGTVDVITDANVSFQITSDMMASGTWTLDGGTQSGQWTAENSCTVTLPEAVTEGEHALTLQGENENGDALRVQYRFRVDCSGPALLISAPVSGSFFGGTDSDDTAETVTLEGRSEPGTTVSVKVGGVDAASEVVDETGEFHIAVVLDETKLQQTLTVSAVDAAGNEAAEKEITLNNAITGAEGVYLGIFLNGVDVTNRVIPAGSSGAVELRFVAGDRSVVISDDSRAGRQVEWNLSMLDGYGSFEEKYLTVGNGSVGLLQASYGRQTAAVGLGGGLEEVKHMILISEGEGYTVHTQSPIEVPDGGEFRFTVELKEGYSATENFAVTANGVTLTPVDGVYVISGIHADKHVQVTGVADITAPEVTITVSDNSWKEFLSTITFGLFFKDSQTVTLAGADAGSGLKDIVYYVSEDAMTLEDVKAITDWVDYTEAFTLAPNRHAVVYAKAADNAGNICYVSSDGIVLDAEAPKIEGIEDGGSYTGSVTVTVTDTAIAEITVNGVTVYPTDADGDQQFSFELTPAERSQTVVVTDKAGNVVTYIVTVSEAVPVPPVDMPDCDRDESCVLSRFTDVDPNESYHDGLHYCVEFGLMNGMTATTLEPHTVANRAMMITMLYRMAGEPSVEGMSEPFTDVNPGDWYYEPVVWAYHQRVVNGTSETTFEPGRNVSREQVATILHRYSGTPEGTGDLSGFPDEGSVSGYAREAMAWAVGEGLINGVVTPQEIILEPNGSATRAQIAIILMRYYTEG